MHRGLQRLLQRDGVAGRTLGEFVLGDKLGEGGFGTVYRAQQRTLDRAAVVKTLRRSLADDALAIERFTLEARLASRFDHPYAAHIYAFGSEPDGLLWIAMEMVRGTPLDQLIAQTGPMPVDRFVPLMERLCEVVQAAHDQGIVHRDIKPSNVMVIARSGRLIPKLLDFGIAKMLGSTLVAPAPPRVRLATGPVKTITHPEELEDTAAATGEGGTTGALTVQGQILGSPLYMAPEQWNDASRVGPRTDQYALALLAFEVMSGKRAFSGITMSELLAAHASDPLPLPESIPAPLHAVLARAAAKDPDARFANLHDFAAALRAAASPAAEVETRIAIPDAIAAWAADAPRPIAEAMAALAAARSPIRVADRAATAANALAHWLGVLALACRSRLGALDHDTDVALLRELRKRALRPDEWLDVAAAIVAPFRDRPEAFPIPELAQAELAALREPSTTSGDDVALATARVERLATALASLAWLLDYEVARETEAGLELWMGVHADEPIVRAGRADELGRIVVLDADGARVAALSPIVQVAAPAAGEPAQMFVLAGPGRTARTAQLVAPPRQFELDASEPWPWLADHVLALAPGTAQTRDDERSPYPGLASFGVDDHDVFVGRERDVEEVLNRLRVQPLVAIVGPSGVGKSSFLAAGIVGALPAGWIGKIIRPGHDPRAALATVVTRDAPYRDAASGAGTLVIAVDQGEELFTMCTDDAARVAFADALAEAARSPHVRVVIAMRDDFLARAEELPAWRGAITRAAHVLHVPDAAALERMLTAPARERGYDFDDAKLPGEIARDVAGRAGALPLLAFAAAELWERRDRHFKRLARASYEQIGGVTGALVDHADGVVDRMTAGDQRLVRVAFRRLLTEQGTRASIGRAELVAALGSAVVVDRLLDARLVVSRDTDAGERIEIVHEALVDAWPRLAEWRREDDAAMRFHAQLATAARGWNERDRATDRLWRGEALVELRGWRARVDLGLTPTELAFADASEASARASRRRRVGLVGGALAVLAVGVAVLFGLNRVIEHQRDDATTRVAANLQERARLALAQHDAWRGSLFLAEARRLGATGAASDLLVAEATAAIESQRGPSVVGSGTLRTGRIDARTIVSNDAAFHASVRDRATGVSIAPAMDHIADLAIAGDDIVTVGEDGTLAVSPRTGGALRWHARTDGAFFVDATVAGDAVVAYAPRSATTLWSLHDGAMRGELGRAATVAVFDPSGAHVATGDASGAVSIWDATTARLVTACPGHADRVTALRFSPDGRVLASGAADRAVRLCDVATGSSLHELVGHTGFVAVLELSPDGKLVASAGEDGTPRVWDVATGALVARFDGHLGRVDALDFSPDGRYLATAGFDSSVRVWDLDGTELASLQGAGRVFAWAPDGQALTIVGYDGDVRQWDLRRALRGRTIQTNAPGVGAMVLSADEAYAAVAARDHVVVVELATGARRADIPATGTTIAAFSPDGSRLAVADERTLTVRSVSDATLLHTLDSPGADAVTFLPDGTLLAGSRDHIVRVWDADGSLRARVDVGVVAGELVFDPSSRFVAVGPTFSDPPAHEVPILDLHTLAVVAHLHADHADYPVAFDATRIAVMDGPEARAWELGTWRPLGVIAHHDAPLDAIAFLPDGRLLTAGEDRKVLAWDKTGRLLASLEPASSRAWMFAASRDGATFASTSYDGVVRVWTPRRINRCC